MIEKSAVLVSAFTAAVLLWHVASIVLRGDAARFDLKWIGASFLAAAAVGSLLSAVAMGRAHAEADWSREPRQIGLIIARAARYYSAANGGNDPPTLEEARITFTKTERQLVISIDGAEAWTGENFYSYEGSGVFIEGRHGAAPSVETCANTAFCIAAGVRRRGGTEVWRLSASGPLVLAEPPLFIFSDLLRCSTAVAVAAVVGALIDRLARRARGRTREKNGSTY